MDDFHLIATGGAGGSRLSRRLLRKQIDQLWDGEILGWTDFKWP